MQLIPKEPFPKPNTVHSVQVCALTGLLPGAACGTRVNEWFANGTEPTKTDTSTVLLSIDTRNGLRATPNCDPRFIAQRVFTSLPEDVREWGRGRGYIPPPVQYSPLCGGGDAAAEGEQWLRITRPNDNERFLLDPLIPDSREMVTFTASAGTAVKDVQWYINGTKVAIAPAPDFLFRWKPEEGNHVVTARAGSITSQIDITVLSKRKNTDE